MDIKNRITEEKYFVTDTVVNREVLLLEE